MRSRRYPRWPLRGAPRCSERSLVARGLAMSPRLILMDEVTGGVDQRSIAGLVALVRELKQRGLTIVMIEHNMQVIMRLADRVSDTKNDCSQSP